MADRRTRRPAQVRTTLRLRGDSYRPQTKRHAGIVNKACANTATETD
jgi:hypothetical protein